MAQNWRGYVRYRELFMNVSDAYRKRSDLRAFLEITLSLSTIIIFLAFALKPTAITIIDLIQQIEEKQATLSMLTKKVADLQVAQNVLQQNKNVISSINMAVPDGPNPNLLSEQVEGLVAKYEMGVLGISIDKILLIGNNIHKETTKFKPPLEGVSKMAYSISVDGNYTNLSSFMHDFVKMRILSKIDTLDISSTTNDKGLTVVAIISGGVPFIENVQ